MIQKSSIQINKYVSLYKTGAISLNEITDKLIGVGATDSINQAFLNTVLKGSVTDTVIKADRALRLIHNTQGQYENSGFLNRTVTIKLFDDDLDDSCFIVKLQHDVVAGVFLKVVTDDDNIIEINIELPPTGSGYANQFKRCFLNRVPEPGFNLIGELADFIEDYQED